MFDAADLEFEDLVSELVIDGGVVVFWGEHSGGDGRFIGRWEALGRVTAMGGSKLSPKLIQQSLVRP